MKTKNIEQTVLIRATPDAIYAALMNGRKHSQFTGEPAKIRAKIGAVPRCGTTTATSPASRWNSHRADASCRRGAHGTGRTDNIPS